MQPSIQPLIGITLCHCLTKDWEGCLQLSHWTPNNKGNELSNPRSPASVMNSFVTFQKWSLENAEWETILSLIRNEDCPLFLMMKIYEMQQEKKQVGVLQWASKGITEKFSFSQKVWFLVIMSECSFCSCPLWLCQVAMSLHI